MSFEVFTSNNKRSADEWVDGRGESWIQISEGLGGKPAQARSYTFDHRSVDHWHLECAEFSTSINRFGLQSTIYRKNTPINVKTAYIYVPNLKQRKIWIV